MRSQQEKLWEVVQSSWQWQVFVGTLFVTSVFPFKFVFPPKAFDHCNVILS